MTGTTGLEPAFVTPPIEIRFEVRVRDVDEPLGRPKRLVCLLGDES